MTQICLAADKWHGCIFGRAESAQGRQVGVVVSFSYSFACHREARFGHCAWLRAEAISLCEGYDNQIDHRCDVVRTLRQAGWSNSRRKNERKIILDVA